MIKKNPSNAATPKSAGVGGLVLLIGGSGSEINTAKNKDPIEANIPITNSKNTRQNDF